MKNQTWLQLSQRQRMSPFPNYLSMESICNESEKLWGIHYQAVVMHYQQNLQTVFVDKKDYNLVSRQAFEKLNKDHLILKQVVGNLLKL